MSDDELYFVNDPIVDWECYAIMEGLTDEQLQELLHGDSVD